MLFRSLEAALSEYLANFRRGSSWSRLVVKYFGDQVSLDQRPSCTGYRRTGLGLAIVHQLSLAIGGTLKLENRDNNGLVAEKTIVLNDAAVSD